MTKRREWVDPPFVEQQPVAEILPGLYRTVLDAVADLELRGLRRDAAKIRSDATQAYSGAWNAAAARRLRVLAARAARIVASRRARKSESLLAAVGRHINMERTTL